MGHTMALSLFDNSPFFHPQRFAPRSSLFAEMDSMLHNQHSMFGAFNHHRDKFLSDMEVEAGNGSHSFSSTSSIQTDAVVASRAAATDATAGAATAGAAGV